MSPVDREQADRIERKLDRVLALLEPIFQGEIDMTTALDDLTAQVAAETTEQQSLIVLLNGISAQLASALAANDTVALQALSTQLQTNVAAMAAAVTANTPSAPATPPATPAA